MGASGVMEAATAGLVLIVAAVIWSAAHFVVRSRRHARRPWLPYDDRPPAGLKALRPAEFSAEVEAGLAAMIGYLRRRALQS